MATCSHLDSVQITELPDDVVERTRAKYVEAYERLTGSSFDSWLREG